MLVNGRLQELKGLIQDIKEIMDYQEYAISNADLLDRIVADLELIVEEHKPTKVADMLAALE